MADLHFERIPIAENNDPLVDIASYPFVAEPVYYRRGFSDTPLIHMRKAVAEKLARLQDTMLQGYQFKIWDAWRPRRVQATIYHKYLGDLRAKNPGWDEEKLRREVRVWVMHPDETNRIPQHATGGAVDLTLIDRKTGRELEMGTVFDHIGDEARPYYFDSAGNNPLVRDNRRMLITAMHAEDFRVDPDEWWHFDYGNQKWAEAIGRSTALYGEVFEDASKLTPPYISADAWRREP